MPIAIIVVIALLLGLYFARGQSGAPDFSKAAQTVSPPPELTVYTLRSGEKGDVILKDGEEYFSWEGEYDEPSDTQVWDWHGRMGEGLGFLARDSAIFYDGEVYTLRGRDDILLAFLPNDGWPITDMKLFLRAGETLPEVRSDGFSAAEIFRIEGEFLDEELEKVTETSDPAFLSALAEAWLAGEEFDPPEADYDRYRVRLYSSEVPGLYVNVDLNVNEDLRCCAVEKYRFSGCSLLPFPGIAPF